MTETYTNKFLMIDLSCSSFETFPVPDAFKTDFIGGKGFGAKLLYDKVPPGTDPLDKNNLLMFMTGPLTGTMAPAMRGCVVTKSPLTGIFLDSYFGGSFAPEIKYAGYDGIIIKGCAQKPVFIWINDDHVEIRDARHLWGIDTLEANRLIKKELNDDTIKIAGIGQAGENKVLFALIGCEYNRQAGRGGAGAVMGSKNLKAIA
ncbi:aldehyde ferredoxin oxidoreductase N-terminal domain-containing protein, partial [Desulfobacula sp.]